jgi:hypothetical protein
LIALILAFAWYVAIKGRHNISSGHPALLHLARAPKIALRAVGERGMAVALQRADRRGMTSDIVYSVRLSGGGSGSSARTSASTTPPHLHL